MSPKAGHRRGRRSLFRCPPWPRLTASYFFQDLFSYRTFGLTGMTSFIHSFIQTPAIQTEQDRPGPCSHRAHFPVQENGQKCVNPSDESVVGDGELRGGEQDGVAAATGGRAPFLPLVQKGLAPRSHPRLQLSRNASEPSSACHEGVSHAKIRQLKGQARS